VALTLTPMLCSRVLSRHGGHGEDADAGTHGGEAAAVPVERAGWFDRFFSKVSERYEATVRLALRRRGLVVGLTGLLIAGIAGLYLILPKELVPTEDRGWIFTFIRAPEGATLDYTDRYTRRVEQIYENLP